MNRINWHYLTSFTVGVFFLTLSTAALAQYVWLDENGVKQYSDMAPPASVPKNHILKTPGQASRSIATIEEKPEGDANADVPAVAKKDKPPMTTLEKNAAFQKRKIEQAEKEKKSGDEEKRLADKAKNCDRARQYQTALAEGHRIGQIDSNGEQAYISDEQRAQELKENQQVLNDCK